MVLEKVCLFDTVCGAAPLAQFGEFLLSMGCDTTPKFDT